MKSSPCTLRGEAASIVNNTFLTGALGGCACNSNCNSLRRVLLSWTGTGNCSVMRWKELGSGSIGVIHAAWGFGTLVKAGIQPRQRDWIPAPAYYPLG